MQLKVALKNISEILNKLSTFDIVKSRKKSHIKYFKMPITFDIECTNYSNTDIKCGICYFWSIAVTPENVYTGRTLEEFKQVLIELNKGLRESGAYLVIYIHNFAYEWQFIRKMFRWEEIFLTDNRRPLYARTMCFEFRCSYLLSNMTLENFLKNNDCVLQKLPYDYTKNRYSWTPLTEAEMLYCAHDTAGLLEAILHVMEKERDSIATIPLTSTGYVRRDLKKVQDVSLRNKIKRLNALTPELYYALNHAFVGGNTHANKMYTGEIIDDVTCYDITSSYPYAQLCNFYPMEPFRRKTKGLDCLDLDSNFAYLIHVIFYEIELKDYMDGCPTISISKCLNYKNIDSDNGRVSSATYVELWVTDIEYGIVSYHYRWEDRQVLDVYYSSYGSIPDEIKSCIYTYFENKCTLKDKDSYLYRKSKEKLNAIYGMSAFDIGKRRYKYENDNYVKDDGAISSILYETLNHSVQAEPYMWGVWTTANARRNLDEMIRLAEDRFIYCDTDSVYVYGTMDDEISTINDSVKKAGAPYMVHTEVKDYYIGVWAEDKKCKQFVTLGAKKYAYETYDGIVHTVTAGVNKAAGVKRIEDYKIGYTFKNATNTAWYTDENLALSIEGHTLNIPTSVYIEPNDYTLGITSAYYALLSYISGGTSELKFIE